MVTMDNVAKWARTRALPGLLDRAYLRNEQNPVVEALRVERNAHAVSKLAGATFFGVISWVLTPRVAIPFEAIAIMLALQALVTYSTVNKRLLEEFCRNLAALEGWLPYPLGELFQQLPSDDKLREIGAEILVKALSVQHTDAFGEAAALQEFRNRHAVLSRLSMVPENLNECLRVARKRVGKQQAAG